MSKLICGEFEMKACLFSGKQFQMIGRPWAEPTGAFVSAHDLMDHTPQDRGTLEHEFRALGAGLLTRPKLEQYRDSKDVMVNNLGLDLFGVLIDMKDKHKCKTAPEVSLIREEDRNMIWQIEGNVLDRIDSHAQQSAEWREGWKARVPWMMGWFRFGFVLASLRYADAPDVADTFFKLRSELYRMSAMMSNGDRIYVVVDPSSNDLVSQIKFAKKATYRDTLEYFVRNAA